MQWRCSGELGQGNSPKFQPVGIFSVWTEILFQKQNLGLEVTHFDLRGFRGKIEIFTPVTNFLCREFAAPCRKITTFCPSPAGPRLFSTDDAAVCMY